MKPSKGDVTSIGRDLILLFHSEKRRGHESLDVRFHEGEDLWMRFLEALGFDNTNPYSSIKHPFPAPSSRGRPKGAKNKGPNTPKGRSAPMAVSTASPGRRQPVTTVQDGGEDGQEFWDIGHGDQDVDDGVQGRSQESPSLRRATRAIAKGATSRTLPPAKAQSRLKASAQRYRSSFEMEIEPESEHSGEDYLVGVTIVQPVGKKMAPRKTTAASKGKTPSKTDAGTAAGIAEPQQDVPEGLDQQDTHQNQEDNGLKRPQSTRRSQGTIERSRIAVETRVWLRLWMLTLGGGKRKKRCNCGKDNGIPRMSWDP